MLTVKYRIVALHRTLAPVLFSVLSLLAFPAGADIDVSILRGLSTQGSAAAATSTPVEAPASSSQETPNTWYQRASALDRRGASNEDFVTAAHWYRKAAETGHTDAQTNLAVMYTEGRGVTVDGLEAVRWFRAAAEAGNVRAQYSLALMYHLGQGINQDYDDAIHWYESAARLGDANAMNNMAFMYGMGEGVEQSDVEAYAWFALAASRGNANAAENRDLAAEEMTPEDRRKGRQRYTQLEKQLDI